MLLPNLLRETLDGVLDTVQAIEAQRLANEKRLPAFADSDLRSRRLQQAGGIGLITHRAERFGRRIRSLPVRPSLRSSLGFTLREHADGSTRRIRERSQVLID